MHICEKCGHEMSSDGKPDFDVGQDSPDFSMSDDDGGGNDGDSAIEHKVLDQLLEAIEGRLGGSSHKPDEMSVEMIAAGKPKKKDDEEEY